MNCICIYIVYIICTTRNKTCQLCLRNIQCVCALSSCKNIKRIYIDGIIGGEYTRACEQQKLFNLIPHLYLSEPQDTTCIMYIQNKIKNIYVYIYRIYILCNMFCRNMNNIVCYYGVFYMYNRLQHTHTLTIF